MITVSMKLTQTEAPLIGYLHEHSKEIPQRENRPAIIFCPGGGYEFLSDREGDPPAFTFFAKGYQVFVLKYSVLQNASGLKPLAEISSAVMALRENCKEWGIDPNKIAVAGFSAGGHVAASIGVHWDSELLKQQLDTKGGLNRPDALILSYPVITAESGKSHRTSIEFVSGSKEPGDWDFWSLEKHVTEKTPPVFIWHTMTDDCVPVENSLYFVAALHQAGVPCECHLFGEGGHGLSLCREESAVVNEACRPWTKLCGSWLSRLFSFPE